MSVSFINDVVAPNSQVWLKNRELAILHGSGDDFTKAQRIENMYRSNGVVPGTFFRAGGEYDPNVYRPEKASPKNRQSSTSPLMKEIKGYFWGMVLIFIAVAAMNYWNM